MKTAINTLITTALSLLFLVSLTSCGGGNGSSQNALTSISPAASMEAGGFQAISTAVYSGKSQIQSIAANVYQTQLPALYDVNAYQLEYWTTAADNQLARVSGMISVPVKTTPSPLLSYQHATLFLNGEAPSLNLDLSPDSVEILLASLGYIVFSADYIGYGLSHGQSHPYLQRAPSANTVVDLLKAGTSWLKANSIATNGQLFMTGYSQGGYVTMAAARQLQENPEPGLALTAAVYGAGPYDITAAMDALVEDYLSFTVNVPDFLIPGVVDLLEEVVLDDRSDVNFDATVFERYLERDRRDDVHDWRPDTAVKLFHGAADESVPIAAAYSALDTMTALGADVELVQCQREPANHLGCVEPYIIYTLEYFDSLRTD